MMLPHKMSREQLEEEVVYLRGELALVQDRRALGFVAATLSLSPNEAILLVAMANANGRVVMRQHLFDAMERADRNYEPAEKNLDVYICRLRKKLPPASIRNSWGIGYSLVGEGLALIRGVMDATPVMPPFQSQAVSA